MLFAGLASANNLEYRILNYNTMQPVESVNVTVYNGTFTTNGLTDADGFILFNIGYASAYDVSITRVGYTSIQTTSNISNISAYYAEQRYMMQNSNAGIIRAVISDLTLTDHRLCVYYTENMRLDACYTSNDTIIFHNNMNYTIIPVLSRSDVMLNSNSIKKYGLMYYPLILGILIALSLVFAVYYMAKRAGKK